MLWNFNVLDQRLKKTCNSTSVLFLVYLCAKVTYVVFKLNIKKKREDFEKMCK